MAAARKRTIDPFQTLPVTNWNGLVEISCPAPATPITIDCPRPLPDRERVPTS
jgi:hypothetical protein